MDQEAFRALLTAPPSSSSSSSASSRRLLLPNRSNPTLNLTHSTSSSNSESAYKPPASDSLQPRKFNSNKHPPGRLNSNDRDRVRGGYRDRASERRQGLDGDFAEAEHLLQNFQARVAAAGTQVDKDILEQQTKYLGGDERHTILVKGLDHALLERRKAELSEGGKLGQVSDDDLEAAYEHNERQNVQPPLAGPSPSGNGKTKRDELIERLKASRSNSTQQLPDLVVVDRLKAAGKFKPIGATSAELKMEEERLERKRRKAEKKKKKKALKAACVAAPEPSFDAVQHRDTPIDANVVNVHPSVSKSEPAHPSNVPPSSASRAPDHASNASQPELPGGFSLKASKDDPPSPTENENAAQEDFDIFGDAGEYKGLGDSSDDDGEDHLAKVGAGPAPESTTAVTERVAGKKRKTYFEDDEESEDAKVAEQEQDRPAADGPSTGKASMPRTSVHKVIEESPEEPIGSTAAEEETTPRLTRLEGLSGSADIRTILAADAAQEKEERRLAKKQKKTVDGDKVMSEKDRLNKDVMEMERFLKKKKPTASGGLTAVEDD